METVSDLNNSEFSCLKKKITNLKDTNSVWVYIFVLINIIILIYLLINTHYLISYRSILYKTYFVPLFLIFIVHMFAYQVIIPFVGNYHTRKLLHCNKALSYKNNYNNEYSAILISNALKNKWKNFLTNGNGFAIHFLCEYLNNLNKNYKLIQNVSKKDFDNIISDPLCQELYLLGHGYRGGFRTKDEDIDYNRYKNENKKKTIVQLHCGHLKCHKDNTPLAQYIVDDLKNSYFIKGYSTPFQIWFYCLNLWLKNTKYRLK